MNKKYAIGVDLGGTHIAAALVDQSGKTGKLQECDIAPEEREVNNVLNKMALIINQVISEEKIKREEIFGAGIALPGFIDTINGICHFSPNFPGWTDIRVSSILETTLDLPVMILNDVNAFALGEKYFGAGRGVKNIICMTLGTGIGGGIIIDNKLHLGSSQGAGEIGHMTIVPDGPLCGCGNKGCFEALVARGAIIKTAKEMIDKNKKTLLAEVKDLSPLSVFEAAEKGDDVAKEIFDKIGRYLGTGISNLILILNPEKIVIGGRIVNAHKYLFPPAQKEIKKRVKMFPPESTEIVIAELGSQAGLIGGATYVFQQKCEAFKS
ncbi:MAG TPA: ROK family protein [Candidatus Eremiobacteraeota bacterium]|nr:MAG: Glucokinase [bacterium ADurb.Bin363]HPZ08672.1 ROK family protein [Candidatus Eremiobacteraeota bacterium]